MNGFPLENFRSPASLLRFFGVAAVGLLLDLWTKAWSFSELAIDQVGSRVFSDTYKLIPGWLHIEVTTNTGAVFGLGEGKRWLFVAVSVLAIGFLTTLFARSDRQRFYQVVLGMLLAGVIGNMYDRIQLGHVRDMIHALPQWPNLFPWIFNIADVLLCSGVALLVLHSLITPQKDIQAASTEP